MENHSKADKQKISDRLFIIGISFMVLFALALTFGFAIGKEKLEGFLDFRWLHWLGLSVWLLTFIFVRRQARKSLPDMDPYLLPIVALLTGWGLLSIWRLTSLFGARQTLWIAVCGALLIYLLQKKRDIFENIQRYKYLWLISGFLLTTLTFIFGTNPSGIGPDLWLGCCGLYFQPSEPLKLLLIIFLAAYLADRQLAIKNISQLLFPTLVMAGMAFLLLLFQRDLGTGWVFLFIYTSMIYAATGKRRILVISGIIIALALYFGYQYVPLVSARIAAWINPWSDPSGNSYQIIQGLMAIASGSLFGQGPAMGYPNFVPVSHSDFIYTSIVEESGLIGAIALLLLISMLVFRSWWISMRAINSFQRYLAIGIGAYIGSQSLLIIGGTIRMLPLTGVPLPFVSYGGSSLLTSLIAVLILAIISQQSHSKPSAPGNMKALRLLAAVYLIAFFLAAAITGWWALIRGPDLLSRPDNARSLTSIAEPPANDP